jgi:hypothetical protein
MTKRVFFMLFLAIAGIVGANAQVRIGGSEAPDKSAVLDLNPDNDTSSGNATLGLALPRVNLKNSGDAFPLISHVKGLTVYNMATAGDVSPGVYVNNGTKWLRQLDGNTPFTIVEKDSIIGNEVTNATASGGLVRSGAGTAASPYTLGIANGGVTASHIADNTVTNADISNSAAIALNKIALPDATANNGKVLKSNGTNWVAGEDSNSDTNTTYSPGNGLTLSGTTFSVGTGQVTGTMIADGAVESADLNRMDASTGQVLKWNGTAWTPSADAGITTEQDGVVGNEVTGATPNDGLVRSGTGTAASPYTLGISSGGVTNTHLANGAVTAEKLSDNAVTSAKITDGTISNADINASAAIALSKIAFPDATVNNGKVLKSNGTAWIAGDDSNSDTNTTYTAGSGLTLAGTTFSIGTGQVNSTMIADGAVATAKLADKSVAVAKVNATGTASSSTYLRGDGSWSVPAGDGQGVTSVTGTNGITVTNSTTTPVVSLPAGTTSGQVLKWNGTAWASATESGLTSEMDGVVGNEVTGATPNDGLVRSGTGTAASPYTLGIAAGGVTNTHLANGAVTAEKISDNAVTSAKITDGTISNADINASAAIALNKIALPDASTNNGKVLKSNGTAWIANDDNNTDTNTTYTAGNGLSLSETTFSIGIGQVSNAMIADGSVTGAKLADNVITSAKIADGAITNTDISATAGISGSKLADKSVAVSKVNATGTASSSTYLRGDGSWSALAGDGQGVTSVSGANGITVTNGTTTPTVSLPAGTTSGNVLKWNGTAWASAADAGITTEQDGIIGNEVTNATGGGGLTRSGSGTAASPYTLGIASGGVTNTHLADNAVTSAKITDGSVATADLANNSVTSEKITNGAIKAEDLNSMGATNGQVLTYSGSAWEPKNAPKFLGMFSCTVSVSAGSTETDYMLSVDQCNAIGITDTDYSKHYFGIVTNTGPNPAVTSFNIVKGDDYFYPYVKLLWGKAVSYSFQTQVHVLVYEY